MSNEETEKLIDLVAGELPGSYDCSCKECMDRTAEVITGVIQSRYKIEPLENTVEEEATK